MNGAHSQKSTTRDLPTSVYRRWNKYRVYVKWRQKIVYLGSFSTVDDAVRARDTWRNTNATRTR